MRIDAHQHFWEYDPKRHGWINDGMHAIRKDFSPNDLHNVMTQNGVSGCIAVQVDETEEETNYLINLASENNFIKGVVGWIDLKSTSAEERMQFWKSHTVCKGFRCIMQGAPSELFLSNKNFREGVKKLSSYEYTYDLLVYHNQIPELISFTDQLPDNKMILDHLGKPDIKNKEIKKWKEQIRILAQHPGIYCKFSGLITEADHKKWKTDHLLPYLEIAAEYFGTDRICFGTDWPVCLLAGSYAKVIEVIETFASQLNTADKNKLFAENTMKFYNLY